MIHEIIVINHNIYGIISIVYFIGYFGFATWLFRRFKFILADYLFKKNATRFWFSFHMCIN